jgi:hypothetical protein
MDFADRLRELAARLPNLKSDMLRTEEATKNALIMPFIQVMGYDVFNPLEVTPELIPISAQKKARKLTMLSSKMANLSCFLSANLLGQTLTRFMLPSFIGTFQ